MAGTPERPWAPRLRSGPRLLGAPLSGPRASFRAAPTPEAPSCPPTMSLRDRVAHCPFCQIHNRAAGFSENRLPRRLPRPGPPQWDTAPGSLRAPLWLPPHIAFVSQPGAARTPPSARSLCAVFPPRVWGGQPPGAPAVTRVGAQRTVTEAHPPSLTETHPHSDTEIHSCTLTWKHTHTLSMSPGPTGGPLGGRPP